MKKRFIYYNGEYPESEKDSILYAANMSGSCGRGKISAHLANEITLEREEASEVAILTIHGKTHRIVKITGLEMIQGDTSPTIYVLESEHEGWKQQWRKNRNRLKKSNVSLLGIKDLPKPKQEEEMYKYRENVPISRQYCSYQHQEQCNVHENELPVESPEAIKSNKKKTALVNVFSNKGKYNGKCAKTFLLSLISVGTAFYAHSGKIFPYPYLREFFTDCVISVSIICFTWCALHIAYLMVEEIMVGIIVKATIDRKWTANVDKEVVAEKTSEILVFLFILLIAPFCVFFCI